MRIFVILLLVLCLGCNEKVNQSIILTPRNNDLSKKMKAIGCECVYQEVKNKFFYNKNTGLYLIGITSNDFIFNEEYKACMSKLTLGDIERLYGPAHAKDENNMYYYSSVMYCGQRFYGLRFEHQAGKIIDITTHVQEFAFPDDDTKQFNIRCNEVDFLDAEKLKINQGFFEYFENKTVDENFEVAKNIEIQPKFEHPKIEQRCLNNVRFEQTNLVYNKNIDFYVKNFTPMNGALPLMGYGDGKECISFFDTPELLIKAYGVPSYMSKNKDTLSYIIDDENSGDKILTESFFFYDDYNAYGRGPLPLKIDYNFKQLPKDCNEP